MTHTASPHHQPGVKNLAAPFRPYLLLSGNARLRQHRLDLAAEPQRDPSISDYTSGMSPEIRVLLFDVGGVLVQLDGVETMLEWLGNTVSADEFWRIWLQSPSVRKFETGKIDAGEFTAGVMSEFSLRVEPQRFLESFTAWPTGLYPGTLEMLARIPSSYRRALLSNSNALHWTRVIDDMGLGPAFHSQFASHLTGRIKPDTEAFQHAVDALGCSPNQVLFLDDNLLNVEAAQRFGMHSVRVRGSTEAEGVLIDLGIIEGPTGARLPDDHLKH
jgi:HAD superfamily hydrolase (TIGR01509 family)